MVCEEKRMFFLPVPLFQKRQSLAHNEVDTLLAYSSAASCMQIQLNTLYFEMTGK